MEASSANKVYSNRMRRLIERIAKRVVEWLRNLLNAIFLWLCRTTQIAIQFGDNTMNSVTLVAGQSTTGTIVPLEADGVTQTPGAVVSAQSFSIPPDPSFGATDNGDGTLTITGNAASVAPVVGTASAIVTDADGAVATFTTSFTINVTSATPPPTGLTASIGVQFTLPA